MDEKCQNVQLSSSSSSSVACIVTERSSVHNAAPSDAVLCTPPGRVEAKVLRSRVLLHSPQPGGSRSTRRTFPFLVGTNCTIRMHSNDVFASTCA